MTKSGYIAEKIEFDNDRCSHALRTALGFDLNPEIDGKNVFTGFAAPDSVLKFRDSSMALRDEKSWQAVWKMLGQEPPGKLPDNAAAIFIFEYRSDKQAQLEVQHAFFGQDDSVHIACARAMRPLGINDQGIVIEQSIVSYLFFLFPSGGSAFHKYNDVAELPSDVLKREAEQKESAAVEKQLAVLKSKRIPSPIAKKAN